MYSCPFVSSFVESMIAVSQVVVGMVFLLVAPSAGGVLESEFSTLEVVTNGLIEAFSVFLFPYLGTLLTTTRWFS